MQNYNKIINDAVFGFITIPNKFLYTLLQHPTVQRLNRIKQLGLTFFVYPGALHSRFQHSLGAMGLMQEAIKQLREKGTEITEDEAVGAMAAILLHDIGHAPFSHVLEESLVDDYSHEELSLQLMKRLNDEMGGGQLDIACDIFENKYKKKFLHQLVSGQLDMDRLDYLRRDNFYTGVTEGVIGSARIIKVLCVEDDELAVEEKGLYSIENFLIARRSMYWQVYLHKTSLAAETMLRKIIMRAKYIYIEQGRELFATPALRYFISQNVSRRHFVNDESKDEALTMYLKLDDNDIWAAIKVWADDEDIVLSELCSRFVNRGLFKVKIESQIGENEEKELNEAYQKRFNISKEDAEYFYKTKLVTSSTYNDKDEQIKIRTKTGLKDIASISDMISFDALKRKTEKTFLLYLK